MLCEICAIFYQKIDIFPCVQYLLNNRYWGVFIIAGKCIDHGNTFSGVAFKFTPNK